MIHKYTLNGFHIVLDTNSGAVHLFDPAPYDLLDYLDDHVPAKMPAAAKNALSEKYDDSTLNEAYRELLELQEKGQLFSSDDYGKFAGMMKDAPIKSMCLNIAHDCNLRCAYCFAAQGDFGKGRMLMPFKVAKAAIDFLIQQSANRHNLEV
ncbi:MAG TPA: thioether cross-link-forming SCIFF peptide maturase, partial [Ruminococcaceae bacterium]|nr:thioether cross-link-forming SCIFF peptide maturase [Oscillospiraceae bacterium]HCM23592.1 thioether cross-link-forming SCIFF peptide maturase [Oscillospiraceae bacterium]